MKIILVVLAVLVGLSSQVDYHRPKLKVRGPSTAALHRRQHLMPENVPHYMKKWQIRSPPPPPPPRSRPIPVHMPSQHKIPLGVPPPSRPIAPPVRNFWKSTQKKIKQQMQIKPHHFIKPEKTYLTLPAITLPNSNDFDHQIHTNVISTHTNPIKQVGEKGPIHTIPAPNLSLADRPNNIEILQPQKSKIVGEIHHQYQVTEPAETPNLYHQQQQVEVQPQQLYYMTDSINFQPQNEDNAGVNTKELLELLEQQPALLQAYAQPQFAFPTQAVVPQTALFQPEVNYVQQASEKLSISPEYHSFNYDEQQHQKSQQQARRQTEFSPEAQQFNFAMENGGNQQETVLDPVAQATFIQKFFDTRSSDEENNVEPDAKPAEEQSEEETKQQLLSSAYYSALPNQEAAETLAQLQAAGKVNSNLMKMSQNVKSRNSMTIYVPDDSEETVSEQHGAVIAGRKDTKDVEDYDDEDEDDGQLEEEPFSDETKSQFGHKIKRN